mmetsp:Transcript_153279/g.267874  ORF Transcript_153279/g.267874 Transcript_153279/m.267874 type:complete len:252 (+) Transcript_153279:256-1011(+)
MVSVALGVPGVSVERLQVCVRVCDCDTVLVFVRDRVGGETERVGDAVTGGVSDAVGVQVVERVCVLWDAIVWLGVHVYVSVGDRLTDPLYDGVLVSVSVHEGIDGVQVPVGGDIEADVCVGVEVEVHESEMDVVHVGEELTVGETPPVMVEGVRVPVGPVRELVRVKLWLPVWVTRGVGDPVTDSVRVGPEHVTVVTVGVNETVLGDALNGLWEGLTERLGTEKLKVGVRDDETFSDGVGDSVTVLVGEGE